MPRRSGRGRGKPDPKHQNVLKEAWPCGSMIAQHVPHEEEPTHLITDGGLVL